MDSSHVQQAASTDSPAAISQQTVSGRYTLKEQHMTTELRLDVDGYYPQMAASGTRLPRMRNGLHWIASELRQEGQPDTWVGRISKIYGNANDFMYNGVRIKVNRSPFPGQQTATLVFFNDQMHMQEQPITLPFTSKYFHSVTFEFDRDETAHVVMEIQTDEHPIHPEGLPRETLSIQEVYRRAGFDVQTTGGTSTIPLTEAGPNKKWSNAEMHDAMQNYWSECENDPQCLNEPKWSLWTLFASASDQGPGLGGIMFDTFNRQRQGTALFTNSFISEAPATDPNPEAYIKRNIFWTAIHEMGHAFNLLHSWQKGIIEPWAFSCYDPKALSFMNYPHNYPGGAANFYSKFELRFADQEYLFLRHAPEPFVQMGNRDFGQDNAFRDARVSPSPALHLELRTNRNTPTFRFMEPIMAELKLTNRSGEPQIVDENILTDLQHMSVLVQKDGKDAKELHGFATYCHKPNKKVLMPGESLYKSLFLSVGANGWLVDEPGYYTARVIVHLEHEDFVSNTLRLRVTPPSREHRYDEEFLAQDFFSEEVGRILVFDGSRVLEKGNDTLREIAERLSGSTIAKHAQIALALPLAHDFHILDAERTATGRHLSFRVAKARPEEAKKYFEAALTTDRNESAATLGHIDFKKYTGKFSDMLMDHGELQKAVQTQKNLYQTMSERGVIHRVLRDIKDQIESFQTLSQGETIRP